MLRRDNRSSGMSLTLPAAHLAPAECTKTATIEAGGTCWAVSQGAGISLDQLYQLNPGTNCDSLQVGQQLCVAKGGECAAAAPSVRLNNQHRAKPD